MALFKFSKADKLSADLPTFPGEPNHISPWHDRKKRVWIIGGTTAALIAMVGGVIYAATRDEAKPLTITQASSTPVVAPTPAEQYSNLDGTLVASDLATRHPLAIMVENLPVIRPQTGLSSASVVYEAIVEGGITRFMALFSHTLPEKVGPVRSARVVFLDFAHEYSPVSAYYAHVGGAANALDRLRSDKLYDLDQFAVGGAAYQRFPKAGLATEHTMYTFPEKLYDYVKKQNYKTDSTFRTWKFKDDTPEVDRPAAQTVSFSFSSAPYDVKFVYDKATNSYKRLLAGSEHKDSINGKVITPKNVVIQFASYNTIKSGGKDVQQVGVTGEGPAKILRDGIVTEAKWKKSNGPDRTIYTETATGREIEFNRGQIWISVPKVGTNIKVE